MLLGTLKGSVGTGKEDKDVSDRSAGGPNLTWGLIFILVGITLFLVQLGYLPADLARLWPVILIGLGALMVVRSVTGTPRRGFTAGVVSLAAGVYFAVDEIWGIKVELFFPLLLASIGLALVLRPQREPRTS